MLKQLNDSYLFPYCEIPDVPEVGDIVRVYESETSEYYILGKVSHFDDSDAQLYSVEFYNRGGEKSTIKAKYDLVELNIEVYERKLLEKNKNTKIRSQENIEEPKTTR